MKKYEKIQNMMKEKMATGALKPGDKLPSEAELCRQFSVSRNVVRQALKNLEFEGLSETMKGIGTFCRARTKSENSSKTIGFISFFTQDYIFPQIISAADTKLYPEGYHLILGQSLYDLKREEELLERFIDMRVDGIIMEPVFDGSVEHSNAKRIQHIIESGIPVMFIDNTIPSIGASAITLSDMKSGGDAARYLTERGHESIALFYQEDYLTKVHRMEGAKAYLESIGLTPILFPFTGQGKRSNAHRRALEMIERYDGTFSAVFCSSDEDAMHIIEAADTRGIRIPEDLSIIGFDNQLFSAHNRINLTTFAHPSQKVGRLAASGILEAIAHPLENTETSTILEAMMIERESVADIRS